jgi:hypothetical protein
MKLVVINETSTSEARPVSGVFHAEVLKRFVEGARAVESVCALI